MSQIAPKKKRIQTLLFEELAHTGKVFCSAKVPFIEVNDTVGSEKSLHLMKI